MPVIWFQTAVGMVEMTALGPAPTPRGCLGSLTRGLGAPAGSRTGTPGGRLSTAWLGLVAPATQSCARPRTCQRESVRGLSVNVVRPSPPVVPPACLTHFVPERR